MTPTPVLLPGESHGQRSLVVYSSWDFKELDTTKATEHTHMHVITFGATRIIQDISLWWWGGRAVLFSVRCFHLIAYSASTPKMPWTWPPSNVTAKWPLGDNSPPLRTTDQRQKLKDILSLDFPGGAVHENPPVNAEDTGLIPGLRGLCMPRSSWALLHHTYWACSLEPMSSNYLKLHT